MTSGLVDIILPTQHRPHTLGYAIQAVIAQTYRCWRLHVVCDGCDERTEAVVRSFDDERIAFYRFPKAPGYGYAHRNTVLRRTDGEFVAYATDDDLWLSDHLATGIESLRSRELDLVAFRSALVAVPDRLDPHFFAYDWRTTPGTYWLLRWFVGAVECGRQLQQLEGGVAPLAGQIVAMMVLVAAVHAAAWFSGYGAGHALGVRREDAIGVAFAGSQKTLMVGLAIAIDFGGLAVLPMVAYHVEQLIIDTVLAEHLRARGEVAAP